MSFPSRNARQRGYYLGAVDGDPDADDRRDGAIWYDTQSNTLRAQINGDLHTIDTTVDA